MENIEFDITEIALLLKLIIKYKNDLNSKKNDDKKELKNVPDIQQLKIAGDIEKKLKKAINKD